MRIKLFCATAIAVFFGLVSSASADIVTVTWTGTVGTSRDTFGMFGPANGSLNGDPFSAVYQFDTSIGFFLSTPFSSSNEGGSSLGFPSPSPGVTLTINGISAFIGGSYFATLQAAAELWTTSIQDIENIGPLSINNDTFLGVATLLPVLPVSFTSFTYNFQPGDGNNGSRFDFSTFNGDTLLVDTDGVLNPTTLTVEVSSAVPEPSTWAMMLIGFAGIGFMAYRRQRKDLATA